MLILVPVAPSASGTLRFDWLDPRGVLRDLTRETSPSLFVSRGSAGLGTPGVEPVLEKLPSTAGSIHRYTQTKPLEIDLPLSVHGTTMGDVLTAVENLRSWFDTGNERDRAPGYLRITRPSDDAVRQVACLYAAGPRRRPRRPRRPHRIGRGGLGQGAGDRGPPGGGRAAPGRGRATDGRAIRREGVTDAC